MHDKKSQSDACLPTQTEMLPLPQHGRPLSHAQLAQLWDIVVRAHYLALELGDSCAKSGLESARLALSLSEFLSGWATTFGLELEQAEKTNSTEATKDRNEG